MFRNVRTFTYVTTESDRNAEWEGWRMEGMPHFDPSAPLAVAHDSLEHFPKTGVDGLEDEMLAFGAIAFIRVDGGYWYTQGDGRYGGHEDEVLAYDIVRFIAERGWYVAPCSRRISGTIKDLTVSRGKFNKIVEGEQFDEWDGYERQKAWDAYKTCMRWAAVGYAMAKRRWGAHHPEEVCWLFRCIEKDVTAIKDVDPGDRLEVKFDISTLRYRVDHTKYYEIEENYY